MDIAAEYTLQPLVSNERLQRAAHTRGFMVVVALLAVVLVTDAALPSLLASINGTLAWCIVACILLICCLVVLCQLTVMDRRLSLRLLRSFDFCYLVCTLIVHLWATLLDRDPELSTAHVTLTLFGFTSTVMFLLVMDAQPTVSTRFKQLVAGMHTANSVRWILQNLLAPVNQQPAAQIEFVYPVNARALALSTFSVMGLFFTRYFVQLLRHPQRLIILRVPVCMVNNVEKTQRRIGQRQTQQGQQTDTDAAVDETAAHYVVKQTEGEHSQPGEIQSASVIL